MKLLLAALVCCVLWLAWARDGSLVQRAAAIAGARPNPLDSGDIAVRAGAKLYARECAACHGAHREGHGKVPPLTRADVCQAAPGTLFWILRNGSLTTGMPSFAHLPEPQRWQIVSFLQHHANCAPAPTAEARTLAKP